MEFTLSKERFIQLIQPLTSVCDRKQTMPVLGNVLICVENSRLSLIASDLEIELIVNSDVLGDSKAGEITAPCRKLYEISRSLPENAEITFKLEGEKLNIISGRSRFVLATLPAADFPIIHGISTKIETNIAQVTFRQLIESVQFAMANQDVRYYLNGLLFEGDSENLRMIATDGHRLAVGTVNDSPLSDNEKIHVILPRKAIQELQRLLTDKPEEAVNVQVGDNHIRLATDAFVFVSKLIDGRFPDYKRVLPQGGDKIIEVDRDRLKQGLLRVAILSSEKHRGVRIQLEPGWLRIFANNPEQEHAEEEIELPYEGDNFEIGFNASYLLDVLNTVPQGPVKFVMQDPTCSALIQSEQTPEHFNNAYVVMPLRL